jgi:hypothetical protein
VFTGGSGERFQDTDVELVLEMDIAVSPET